MKIPELVPKASLILLLVAAGSAAAATVDDGFFSNDEYQLAHSLFNTIENDLNHAQTGARIDLARNDLQSLEQNWDGGRFDSQQIDSTISALRAVANDNALAPYEQKALARDLSRLLDFRSYYY